MDELYLGLRAYKEGIRGTLEEKQSSGKAQEKHVGGLQNGWRNHSA
jgi:hypothetical protein